MTELPLILRNKNFLLVWLGQVLSQSGTRMYQIVILWWILNHVSPEESGTKTAIFLMVCALPSILFMKVIGKIIDRHKSKHLLVAAETAASCVIALVGYLMYTDQLTVNILYASGFVTACLQGFVDPTLPKSVPELVAEKDVEKAVAFETSTQSLASFAGAVFGAMLVGTLGYIGCVALNVLSYLLSAGFTSQARFATLDPSPQTTDSSNQSGWAILDSLPFIKKILFVFAAANFFINPLFLALPIYTKNRLNGSASDLASFEASLWLGLIAGAFASEKIPIKWSLISIASVCIATVSACLAIQGVLASTLIFSVALFLSGLAMGINNVKFVTLFQRSVPDEVKGRFFSVMQALLTFTFPISFLIFGIMIDRFNIQTIFLVQGAGLLALAGYLFLSRPAAEIPRPA
ncbi:MAG: MFS transporter [Oligoflexales bacterium]